MKSNVIEFHGVVMSREGAWVEGVEMVLVQTTKPGKWWHLHEDWEWKHNGEWTLTYGNGAKHWSIVKGSRQAAEDERSRFIKMLKAEDK